MKRSMFGGMFAALLTLSLSVMARASTTDELIISSNGATATIQDNGACANTVGTPCASLFGDINPIAGTDTATGSLNGWTINITSGSTNSPSLIPYGLDITSLTASCSVLGGCTGANSLTIAYTDQNFTGSGTFVSGFSETAGSGVGTASQSAYYSDSNALDALTTQIGTTLTFTGTNSGTVSGGAGTTPYSLTLVQTFSGSNSSSFSVDGNVMGSVPEGWSLSSSLGMLGFGVVGLVIVRRRGLLKTSV